jgi:hypothetical protein
VVGYKVIFDIYVIIALYGCIGGGIFTAFETENETNILICAFYLQIIFYENLKGELSATGIVIVLVVSSVFLLPCNILILTIKTLVLACSLFLAVYKRIFRKKPAEGGNADGKS